MHQREWISPPRSPLELCQAGFWFSVALRAFQTREGKVGGPLSVLNAGAPFLQMNCLSDLVLLCGNLDQTGQKPKDQMASPPPCLGQRGQPSGGLLIIWLFRKRINKGGKDVLGCFFVFCFLFVLEITVSLSARIAKFKFLWLHYLFQKLRTCHTSLRNAGTGPLPYLLIRIVLGIIKNSRPHPRPDKSETLGEGPSGRILNCPNKTSTIRLVPATTAEFCLLKRKSRGNIKMLSFP